ncbi:MAG: hypothetical protein J6Y48_10965 [Clostridia bacterium]|nr:hypothetical protein [Clostridia bacterium]
MKSIRAKVTTLTVCAVAVAMTVATLLGALVIRSMAETNAERTLRLLCETGQKNLNAYYDSVAQSVEIVSSFVDGDLKGLEEEELLAHVDEAIRDVDSLVAQLQEQVAGGHIKSTLTNCIVKNNFYGAGFLGGVNGNVESTLIDCTVLGSVFGAGYSAAVPKVNIYNTDRTPPIANTYTGMVTPQSGGTFLSYTWCDTVGTTSSPVTHDTLFYTEIPLVNLGAVSSNVTLTLKGNTKVGTDVGGGVPKDKTGNVYGGGDQSAVEGNTIVNIQGGTTILGNAYGGGNEGPVSGNSEVIIKDN